MKRLMKFGVILMALAVALAGCRTATGSSEVKEMTVNVGITNGTTELKAPVAIKGADFNAIKTKFVAKLELGADNTFEKDNTTYTVAIDKFYSEAAATADKEVQAEAIKGNDTIYVKATVTAITVNIGITDGTTALKAPVAIKGADFNAIKTKFVEDNLTVSGSEHWFIAADNKNIYTVDLGSFFSDAATGTAVQAADINAGNTIYLKATAKAVPVTFAITDGTTKLKDTTVNMTSLDFNTVAGTVASQLGIIIRLGNGGGTIVTIDSDTYTVDMTKFYSDVNATQEVSIDNPIEAIKSGATIYMKATKNN